MNLFFRAGKWVFRRGKIPGPNCREECCDDGGGPGPGDCTGDPDNCFYELKKCNHVHDPRRLFISIADFDRSVLGHAPGDCYWYSLDPYKCYFIRNPPEDAPVPRSQIQPLFDSGIGITVQAAEAGSPTRKTCCNCGGHLAFDCIECPRSVDPNTGLPAADDTPCCCNLIGSCLTIEWTYARTFRSTKASDPDNWTENKWTGGGEWGYCYLGQVPPTPSVIFHQTTGPNYGGSPAPDADVPITQTYDFPGNQDEIYGCISCFGPFFTLARKHGLTGYDNVPSPSFSCRTAVYAYATERTFRDFVNGPNGIEEYIFDETLDVFWSARLTNGTSDCGGGCYDTSAIQAVPEGARPAWVGIVSMFRKAGDAGVGDTAERMLAKVGGTLFKQWFKQTAGRECGCKGRADILNARYPYGAIP